MQNLVYKYSVNIQNHQMHNLISVIGLLGTISIPAFQKILKPVLYEQSCQKDQCGSLEKQAWMI